MIYTKMNVHERVDEPFELSGDNLSLTLPNQALTINEILRRSGVIDMGKQMYYDEDPDHDFLLPTESNGFDLSDVTEIASAISTRAERRKAAAAAASAEALADAQPAAAAAGTPPT